jgi:hypothetical protein
MEKVPITDTAISVHDPRFLSAIIFRLHPLVRSFFVT